MTFFLGQRGTLFVEHKARDGVFRIDQQRIDAFISFGLILVSIFLEMMCFFIPNLVIMDCTVDVEAGYCIHYL
jgi:hypothetical protein